MRLMWWQHQADPDVVASVARQTTEATDLANITGQDRLTDPRTNPAVRPHADRLRDEQHRQVLDAEHTRLLRRHRVSDHRAEHAERALEALQAAREASSAARSVLALHQGRTRFMGAALTASLALSAGSAMGVAALAEKLGAHAAIGYIAEVGLTGLTTTVILYRSHLAQHGGRLTTWQAAVLWLLMVGPLTASIVANAYGTGPVGVACSVGAAAFSLLSYVIADASAEALRLKADKVTGADEANLRAIATGDDLFATARSETGHAASAAQVTDQVMARAADLNVGQGTPSHLTQATPEAAAQVTPQVTQEVATQVTSEVTPEVTSKPVTQAVTRSARKPAGKSASKSQRKPRRTDEELIAELDEIVAEHYRNGGGEIEVKPIAARLGIGRDRARKLLDQMNVRPIRRVAN